MKTIVNSLTYDHSIQKNETFSLPSLTVPNQTLSLKELLNRFTRGQEIPTLEPSFHGEDEQFFDQVSRMDKIEKLEFASQIRGHIATFQNSEKNLKASEANTPVPDTSHEIKAPEGTEIAPTE